MSDIGAVRLSSCKQRWQRRGTSLVSSFLLARLRYLAGDSPLQFQVKISLPGSHNSPGYWPGVWTMGNLVSSLYFLPRTTRVGATVSSPVSAWANIASTGSRRLRCNDGRHVAVQLRCVSCASSLSFGSCSQLLQLRYRCASEPDEHGQGHRHEREWAERGQCEETGCALE